MKKKDLRRCGDIIRELKESGKFFWYTLNKHAKTLEYQTWAGHGVETMWLHHGKCRQGKNVYTVKEKVAMVVPRKIDE